MQRKKQKKQMKKECGKRNITLKIIVWYEPRTNFLNTNEKEYVLRGYTTSLISKYNLWGVSVSKYKEKRKKEKHQTEKTKNISFDIIFFRAFLLFGQYYLSAIMSKGMPTGWKEATNTHFVPIFWKTDECCMRDRTKPVIFCILQGYAVFFSFRYSQLRTFSTNINEKLSHNSACVLCQCKYVKID